MSDPQETNAPAVDSNATEETIRKVYARDLHPKSRVHTVFRASRKTKQTARSGKVFLIVGLLDRTGEVDARVFENADAFDAAFNAGDYVLVEGEVIAFHGKSQLVISKLEKLDPDPIDKAEFLPPPEMLQAPPPMPSPAPRESKPSSSGGGGAGALRDAGDRVSDPNLKAFIAAFADDSEIGDAVRKGGALDHVFAVTRLANKLADQYPMADRDLLFTASMVRATFSAMRETSDEMRLVGPAALAARKIHELAGKLDGFPALLEHHLTHAAIASHGGKEPVTLEAEIAQAIDALDTQVHGFVEALQRDGSQNDRWTEPARPYFRHLWKGAVPTSRGKAPVERGERGEREGKRSRREEKKSKRGGGADKPEPQVEKKGSLAFKPLSELEPSTQPSEATPPPQSEPSAPSANEPANG